VKKIAPIFGVYLSEHISCNREVHLLGSLVGQTLRYYVSLIADVLQRLIVSFMREEDKSNCRLSTSLDVDLKLLSKDINVSQVVKFNPEGVFNLDSNSIGALLHSGEHIVGQIIASSLIDKDPFLRSQFACMLNG
jgi:hypothetical protein